MSIRSKTYLFLMALLSIFIFLYFLNLENTSYSLEEWTWIYFLSFAAFLLCEFEVKIEQSRGSFSMESAVFLAAVLYFGIELSLIVLVLFFTISVFYNKKTPIIAHVFNFLMYSIMLTATYHTFVWLREELDGQGLENIFPYIVALFVYFLINILIFTSFVWSLGSKFNGIFNRGLLKEVFFAYFVTLLLSLVLIILIDNEGFFGLFLFTVLVVLLSITFGKVLEWYQEMANQANKDYLTGLYNHGYFKDYLKELFRETKKTGGQFSIAFLDLDDFKKYNDYHGHVQGDRLLKFVGEYLKNETKDRSFTVARYGGEEFAIILPKTEKHAAAAFMDQLRKKLNDTPFDGVERLPYRCISFSCGIAEYESDMYEESELLHKADQALYYSKAQGKNNVQLYDEKRISRDALKFKEDLDAIEEQLKLLLYKDVYTYRHSKRVFTYAMEFSDRLPLTEEEKRTLILGALVHDIGKIEVSRDIINKKGKLTSDEWEMMKKHVIWGKEIVLSDGRFEEVIPLVELHHERYDGRGYPYGIKGEEIPKLARILCIIDSFDAMTTDRPYQRTKTFSEAIVELRRCSGTQFDPQYVEPFIQMIEEYYPEKITNKTVST
ncbi:bifunctional diguanylate cyclase/phosphohydrolase [Anoxybacillus gonensis]|uniref:bifunctional diguanylate cyclase/phosphohydrolase n=1 Tax=Anoxybacillus gonensis TaxID=198467 RepID=UPI0002BDB2CD|nr:diguanylate cyclase/phosphodiesterase [Anoxybacillus gonensis]